MVSRVEFTLDHEPKGFRVVDGIYTEIMRRIHGETDYTNGEIEKVGRLCVISSLQKTRLTSL